MRLLILGGGVSGRSAAGLGHRLGHDVVIFETDSAKVAGLVADGFSVISDEWNAAWLDEIDAVVASPGFAESSQPIIDIMDAGLGLMSEIEFASRQLSAPYIAVTGTNGKTTVTALIADILAASGLKVVAAGNIGLGLSDIVDQAWDVVAIEVSSFQLRFIDTFAPSVSVLLNVADDHLDWHGSAEAYAAAKARIFENQGPGDWLVYDEDDVGAAALAGQASATLVPVSGQRTSESGYGVRDGVLTTTKVSIPIDDLAVSDAAYLMDMAAAAVSAELLGASPAAVRSQLIAFHPGAHRRAAVGTWSGVTWINDSKATNPHAAVAAAQAYPSVVLIAGGRNKELDLTPLATVPSVRYLIAIGEAADELMASRPGPGRAVDSLEQAVAVAAEQARPGDTVLLAPGCASFDMFENYEARGIAFERIVKACQGEAA